MSAKKPMSRPGSSTKQAATAKLAAQHAAARRRTVLIVSASVIVVLLIAGGIGYAVYSGTSKPSAGTDVAIPRGGTSNAILVGQPDAPVTVDIYLDFQCPICKAFEAQAGSSLQQLVKDGTIRIAYHPVAYLDRLSSGTRYSSRSSSASGCAADVDAFEAFKDALFAQQPPENGTGLTDDELVQIGAQAGADSPGFASCVRTEKYADWTASLTDAASAAGVNGTPTILVNGQTVGPSGQVPTVDQVTAAIAAAVPGS